MARITHPDRTYGVEFQPKAFSAEQRLAFESALKTLEERGTALPYTGENAPLMAAKRELLADYAKLFDKMLGCVMADAKLPVHSSELSRGIRTRYLYFFGLTLTTLTQQWQGVVRGGRYMQTAESILTLTQETEDAATVRLFARALHQPLAMELHAASFSPPAKSKFSVADRAVFASTLTPALDRLEQWGKGEQGNASSPRALQAVKALDQTIRAAGYGKGLAGVAPELMQGEHEPTRVVGALQKLLYPLPICEIGGAEGKVKISPAHAQDVLGAVEALWDLTGTAASPAQRDKMGNALRNAKALLGTGKKEQPPLFQALNGLDAALKEMGYENGLRGLAPKLVTHGGSLRQADSEAWSKERTQSVKVLRQLLGDLVLQKIGSEGFGTVRVTPEGAQKVRHAVAALVTRMNDEKPLSRMHSEALGDALRNLGGNVSR